MKVEKIPIFIKKYKKQVVCFCIFLVAMTLRIIQRVNFDLWCDEYAQFWKTNSLQPFWKKVTFGDHSVFPGEYLLGFPFAKIFGYHKWGLAIPHFIVTVISFYLLYRLCSRYYRSIWAYVIAFVLVCFNKSLIFHALEYRPYAVIQTLAVGSLYFSDLIVKQFSELSRKTKIWIGVYLFVATNYHAYGIVMAFAPVLYTVLTSRKQNYRDAIFQPFIGFFLIVFLISAPVWAWYASYSHFGFSSGHAQGILPTFQYIPNPIVDFIGFTKAILGNMMGGRRILYWLLLGGVFTFFLPHQDRLKQLGFVLLLIVLPIQMMLYADLRSRYPFMQRQFVWQMPLFAFFLGWCWDSIIVYFQNYLKRGKA